MSKFSVISRIDGKSCGNGHSVDNTGAGSSNVFVAGVAC